MAQLEIKTGHIISRRTVLKGAVLGGAGLGLAACTPEQLARLRGASANGGATASPDANASTAPSVLSTEAPKTGEGDHIANAIPVPDLISGAMVRALRAGTTVDMKEAGMFTEGQWFLPVHYNTGKGPEDPITHKIPTDDYRGIGPWYPVAFENVDESAAVLTTHGNPGEVVVSGRKGGDIMVAFMQLDAHQHDGAWGTDPKTKRFEQNPNWEMQYNFHSLQPLQEIMVVDPDTGNMLLWEDGSPVIYRANEKGIAAFEIPATKGNDVRVGFVFHMSAQGDGEQAPEVKIERGPNDNPKARGENPLPKTVLKPMVALKS